MVFLIEIGFVCLFELPIEWLVIVQNCQTQNAFLTSNVLSTHLRLIDKILHLRFCA